MVEWDEAKDAENVRKRQLPLRFAELLFDGAFIEEEDVRRDYGEPRFQASGPIAEFGGRIFVVIYRRRGPSGRIISFRKANDRESENTRRMSREEVRAEAVAWATPERLAALDAITDADIAAQIAEDPDVAPELTDEWFENARLVTPLKSRKRAA